MHANEYQRLAGRTLIETPDVSRVGDWMQLVSGRRFWPLDPRPEDVYIDDIAHALSMMCRYGGHTTRFYSVAEHCVYVSRACSPKNALAGLLHDASEAYATDIIRPIKPFLAGYAQIEDRLSQCIAAAFHLAEAMPAEVKAIDTAILKNEYDQVMSICEYENWGLRYAGVPGLVIHGWSPAEAKAQFMARFRELTDGYTAEASAARVDVCEVGKFTSQFVYDRCYWCSRHIPILTTQTQCECSCGCARVFCWPCAKDGHTVCGECQEKKLNTPRIFVGDDKPQRMVFAIDTILPSETEN